MWRKACRDARYRFRDFVGRMRARSTARLNQTNSFRRALTSLFCSGWIGLSALRVLAGNTKLPFKILDYLLGYLTVTIDERAVNMTTPFTLLVTGRKHFTLE